MMKRFRAITALVLAVMMVMGMLTLAWAGETESSGEGGSSETPTTSTAATLTNGEVGGFGTPDAATSQKKSIILKKEITAYSNFP